MPKIQSDDQVTLSYEVFGEGQRDVLLVHGWMMSGAVFSPLLSALNSKNVRLIVPDLRGTGASGAPETGYTIERYARDLLAVADAAGAHSFVLLGHSMGGQIAQWVASSVPDRIKGLILLNTVPAGGIPLPPEAVELFRNSAGNAESQEAILGMACKLLSEEAKERMLEDAGKIPAACIQEAFDSWTAGGFAEKIGAISARTLVLATDDPFLPADFLKQAVVDPIPNASLAYLPGPGHYPQVERVQETAAIVDTFLAALT